MKKTYITPKTKAVKVQASTIICNSPNSVKLNDKAVLEGTNEYSDKDGYGIAW